MADAANRREWPLVVFTLALQMSCGLVTVLTLIEAESGRVPAMRPLGLAAFPIAVLGMLVSALHLGRPLSAWKSLRNLGRSRLSMEVLLTGMFALTCAAYGWTWVAGLSDVRFPLSIIATVTGLAAVVSSASIYMVPTQPSWNSWWVLVSFVGTSLALGGATCAALISRTASDPSGRAPAGLTVAGSCLVLASAVWMAKNAFVPTRAGVRQPTVQRFRGTQWLSFALYVVLAGALPVVEALQLLTEEPVGVATPAAFITLAGVLVGALFGRTLMYSLAADSF
ncbi:MAG TPA: DmsC/YnfH family molybdoenzyme membrane anchor subunit [Terriglobales bacterium]|nr:DmsC/YnfH family molybdoenzyme membrane anchor subunit [Terriglobales bacterium]